MPFIAGVASHAAAQRSHDRASGSPSDSVQELCRAELIEELCAAGRPLVHHLGSKETKSGRPDVRRVDRDLNRAVALYLTWSRPVLLGATTS